MSSLSNRAMILGPVKMGKNVNLEDNVKLGCSETVHRREVIIGDGSVIKSGSSIYEGAHLGKKVLLEHNVVVKEGARIGDDTAVSGSKKVEIGENVIVHDKVTLSGDEIQIGVGTEIGPYSKLVFRKLHLGTKVIIHQNANIVARNIQIDDDTEIGENVKVFVGQSFVIGKHGKVGRYSNFESMEIKFGDHLYAGSNFRVGGGGSNQPQSRLEVGHRCHFGNNAFINTSEPVLVGDDSSLGVDGVILTHGAWHQVLDGYLSKFAPVRIGNKVWIPHHVMILPGVTIGDGSSIGAGAVVTKDIPPNCFAAGIPAKVFETLEYPKKLTLQKKEKIVEDVLDQYVPIIKAKGYHVQKTKMKNAVIFELQKKEKKARILYSKVIDKKVVSLLSRFKGTRLMLLSFKGNPKDLTTKFPDLVFFDFGRYSVTGNPDELSEDLRDFLRRMGIKIYSSRKFKSMTPVVFEELKMMVRKAEEKSIKHGASKVL